MTTLTFTPKDIERVARLAALNINAEDIPAYCTSLSNTFTLISQLQQIDTDQVQPMSSPLDAMQRLRKDQVSIGNMRDALLAGCPDTEAGLVLVPKVIE